MTTVIEKLTQMIDELENYLHPELKIPTKVPTTTTKVVTSATAAGGGGSAGIPTKAEKPTSTKATAAKDEDADSVGGSEMSKCCFRVAKILTAKAHPESEKLYIESVDVGEATPRTAVSGLAKHIPLSELQNRLCVVITNLEPKKVAGVISPCMVMAVSIPIPGDSEGGKHLELLDPPEGANVGERITVKGHEGMPLEMIKGKHVKKVFQKVLEDLRTNEQCIATYQGIPLMTSLGPCRSRTLANGNIS